MDRFIDELSDDVDWRIREISSIRTLPFRYRMTESDQNIILMSSIPTLYSLWEGFMVNAFTLLKQHIERLSIDWRDLHINLLTHSLDQSLSISSSITNFEKKVNFVHKLLNSIEDGITLSSNIPTKSNVNYKVACCILKRFNLPELDSKYEKPLNRLLLYRNKISHGEMAVPVNKDIVNEFSVTTTNLIYDVFLLLANHVNEKCYLKDDVKSRYV